MQNEMVSTLNITRPSAPAREDPLGANYMDTVEKHPSIALPVLFARDANFKVLTIPVNGSDWYWSRYLYM